MKNSASFSFVNAVISGNQSKVEEYLFVNKTSHEQVISYALCQAYALKNFDMIKTILKYTNNPKDYEALFFEAAKKNDLKLTKVLISKGVNVNSFDGRALRVFAENGNLEAIELLVENKANLQADNNFLLVNTVNSNNIELLKYFGRHGLDLRGKNDYAVKYFLNHKNLTGLEYVLCNGKFKDLTPGYIEFFINEKNDKVVVEELRNIIKQVYVKYEVNVKTKFLQAIMCGDSEEMNGLVENNKSINMPYFEGLKIASENGNTGMIKKIIDLCASFKNSDFTVKELSHCLEYAIKNGNNNTVRLLVENGADPFIDGGKAVIHAIESENIDMIKLFFSNHQGFDKNLSGIILEKCKNKKILDLIGTYMTVGINDLVTTNQQIPFVF
jgi:ankyrin repeat protein